MMWEKGRVKSVDKLTSNLMDCYGFKQKILKAKTSLIITVGIKALGLIEALSNIKSFRGERERETDRQTDRQR